MRLLPINCFLLVYLMLLLLLGTSNEVYGQLVTTSDQVAKEGDDEVVIPCDYSQVTSAPESIIWNEINEAGVTITVGIVTHLKTINGRYSLRTTAGKADLVISKPVRNDTKRRFQCQILTPSGDVKESDPPSILTVYYLDEPVLSASASSVNEGGSVTLTCSKPDGDPVPNIAWYKDGQALSTTDATRFDTSEDALEIHIKAATPIDNGRYTCKAESDQFQGEAGKTSAPYDLTVIGYYLSVTFQSEAGIATCTAEGHPKPSSVIIYNGGKMIEEGEVTASVMINEEICQLNITCYAENGEVNRAESLETCNTDESRIPWYVVLIVVLIISLLWVVLLLYFIYSKNIEMAGEDVTAAEGDSSLVMSINYRPSIAHFESFQWDKNEEEKGSLKWKTQVIGSSPKLFSSSTFFFKYIFRCCFYFCGICCFEYYESYKRVEMGNNKRKSEGKNYKVLEMQEKDCERGPGDSQEDIDCSARPDKPAEAPKPREENETFCDDEWDLVTEEDKQALNEPPSVVTDKKGLESCEGGQASSCEKRQITYADLDLSASIATSHVIRTDVPTPYARINHGRKPDGGPSGKKKQGKLSTEGILYADLHFNESTSSKIIRTEEQTPYAKINRGKLGHKGPSEKKKQQGMLSKEEIHADIDLNKRTSSKIIRTEEQTLYAEINRGKLVHKGEASGQNKRDKPSDEVHHSNTKGCCSVTTNGRGTISLKISKSVMISDEGEYKCRIVRGRQQYQHVKNVNVCWIEMVQEDFNAEIGDEFEMKCRYGPAAMCLTKPTWKNFSNDGTSDIDDLSKDSHFQLSADNKGNCMLKISKVTCADAGKYQCTVVIDGKELVATGMLDVKKAPFKLEIPDVTTNDGINIVKLYLSITAEDEASLKDILNITWYKGESREKGNMLISLKSSDRSEHHQTRFEKKKSEAYLSFKDVTTKDTGRYFCEVVVKGRQKIYSCPGLLKVEEPLLQFVNSRQRSIAGEDVNIFYQLSTQRPIKKFIFSKMESGKLKEVATSDSRINLGRFRAECIKESHGGVLLISKVKILDAVTYHCQCVTEDKIGDEYISYSATSQLQVDEKESIVLKDHFASEGGQAVLICEYYIEKEVHVMRWYKKTSNGRQLMSSSKESEMKKIKDVRKNRYMGTYFGNVTRLEIRKVTVDDAGVYICELETDTRVFTEMIKTKSLEPFKFQASANLHVPWNVFTADEPTKMYRHPAVVFVNSHFLAFCEKNNSKVMLRRGKLKGKSTIEWAQPKTILKANDSSFQNLVPIVVDEEKGHVILMCVRRTDSPKKKNKIIVIKSDDNGNTWGGPNAVRLELSNLPGGSLYQYSIGPGHGLRLKSGKLAVSGVSKQETREGKPTIFVMTSDDGGDSWNAVLAPSPSNASLGKHTQIVEYANDQVCITCSLEDCQQRFHVYSNDGCKTFHDAKLEPTLIEANPGCQAGIVSLPIKSDEGFNLIAFTNPASESTFENLLLRLSEDGCETWTEFCKLGIAFAGTSDLAYYEGDGELKNVRGLACVFENISISFSEGNYYSIVMQLISLDEIL